MVSNSSCFVVRESLTKRISMTQGRLKLYVRVKVQSTKILKNHSSQVAHQFAYVSVP